MHSVEGGRKYARMKVIVILFFILCLLTFWAEAQFDFGGTNGLMYSSLNAYGSSSDHRKPLLVLINRSPKKIKKLKIHKKPKSSWPKARVTLRKPTFKRSPSTFSWTKNYKIRKYWIFILKKGLKEGSENFPVPGAGYQISFLVTYWDSQ